MFEGGGDEDSTEPSSSVVGIDKDIAQPRERLPISHPSSDTDLDAFASEQTDDHRRVQRPRHGVQTSSLRPVTLFAQPVMHANDVDEFTLIAEIETVKRSPTHEGFA